MKSVNIQDIRTRRDAIRAELERRSGAEAIASVDQEVQRIVGMLDTADKDHDCDHHCSAHQKHEEHGVATGAQTSCNNEHSRGSFFARVVASGAKFLPLHRLAERKGA